MSDTIAPVVDAHAAPAAEAHHTNYVKIWAILVGLLVVSVLGPMLASNLPGMTKVVVTLSTAFGIAFVKAFLVAKHFMHINLERRFVTWLLLVMLAFMMVMIGGISPDVLKHDGLRWENVAAKAEVARGLKEGVSEHGHGFHEAGHEGAIPAAHEGAAHEAVPAAHE
jgi:caa(3)-type oxidase subunit IV